VDDNKELVTNLILAVCQLCDETRELAQLETGDDRSLATVQDAAHLVTLAIGRIREDWSASALPPALPVEAFEDATAESWLLGDD
jgi:hypothetical protein